VRGDLPASFAAGESLDAKIASSPPHRVTGSALEASGIDGIADTEDVEQLSATGRDRFGERRRGRLARDELHLMTPEGEEARSGASGGPATEDENLSCSALHVIRGWRVHFPA